MRTVRIHIHHRYFEELQKLGQGELFINDEVKPGDRIVCWAGDDRWMDVEVMTVEEKDIGGPIWEAVVRVLHAKQSEA